MYQLYHVTEEDIESQANREISLEAAIARFYEPEEREYFDNHKDEFPVVDISKVAEIITKDIKWTTYMYQYKVGSNWQGWFAFNDDGSIEETYVINGQYNTGFLQIVNGQSKVIRLPLVIQQRKIPIFIHQI